MTFPASFCGYVVLSSAFKANLKEKPSLLCYLFFSCIRNGHLQSFTKKGRFQVFSLSYSSARIGSFKYSGIVLGLGIKLWRGYSGYCSYCEVTAK
jgi:hypothetical protein